MSRTSVSNAVFLTTELLENILGFLPMRDLLLAQRVCRKWRDVITENTRLQQNLFLEAERPTVAWKWSNAGREYRLDRLPELPESEPRYEDKVTFTATLNEMLLDGGDQFESSTAECGIGEIFHLRDMACWRHKPGSWRRMFVTQPPATTIFMEWILGDYEEWRSGYGSDWVDEFHKADGVTLGDVLDYAQKFDVDGTKVNWDRCWFQAW